MASSHDPARLRPRPPRPRRHRRDRRPLGRAEARRHRPGRACARSTARSRRASRSRPSRQTYHCFGCGVHGNAVGFLMEQHGMGFIDAVRDLAQQAGLAVPEDAGQPGEREEAARQKQKQLTLSDVLARAAEGYRRQLKASDRAIAYLKGRGLSGEIAARFGLGYARRGLARPGERLPELRRPAARGKRPGHRPCRRRAATTAPKRRSEASATTASATGSCFRSARSRAR